MKDRDLSRLSGNVDKIVVIGITGGFDHLNKAVFYVTRQRTRPSAAFSALHDAAAGKQQWLGDDTCFFYTGPHNTFLARRLAEPVLFIIFLCSKIMN